MTQIEIFVALIVGFFAIGAVAALVTKSSAAAVLAPLLTIFFGIFTTLLVVLFWNVAASLK